MFIFFSLRWRLVRAAFISAVLLPFPALAASAADLTLAEASRLALQNNQELQSFQWRLKAFKARGETAALKPAYELGIEAENLLGSDEFSGTDAAEWTLSISSVMELGDRRQTRISNADSRVALAQAEREAQALDLLGAVTQSFIAALALQEKQRLAGEAVTLAKTSLELVRERVKRGAAPEAERLRAQAALAQAQLREHRVAAELASRKFTLMSLWGAAETPVGALRGDLYQFSAADDFEVLFQQLDQSPTLSVFINETRVRDAELALIRSQSSADVRWSLGVRRFEADDAAALTAGVSVPLFSSQRNRGEVRAALAEQQESQHQQEAARLRLKASLFEAWQSHQTNVAAVKQMQTDVLPNLELALRQTLRAFEQGRYSYAEWTAAQHELLEARLELIDTATNALLNQALIEQLTGVSLATPTSRDLRGVSP